MKMQKYTFFNKDSSFWKNKKIKEVPFTMAFAMIIMAALCLGMSLLAIPSILDIVLTPAVDALLETVQYSKSVIGY